MPSKGMPSKRGLASINQEGGSDEEIQVAFCFCCSGFSNNHSKRRRRPAFWNEATAGAVRTLETKKIKVDVNASTLCATVTDKVKALTLTTLGNVGLDVIAKRLFIRGLGVWLRSQTVCPRSPG
jgi:hypothetical protein